MQEATPLPFSKFNPSKETITFRPMRNVESANGTVNNRRATLLYNGQPLWLQSPKMHAPFGASRGKKDDPSTYNKKVTVSLNLEKGDDNSTYAKMVKFQNLIIDAIYENRTEWVTKGKSKNPKDITRDEIAEHMFNYFISEPKEGTSYQPIMRVNLNVEKAPDGTVTNITTAVWNSKRERVTDVTDASIPSRSNLKLIMGAPYVYYIMGTNKFGVVWRVHSLQVFPGAGLPVDGCFFNDQDVDEMEASEPTAAVVATPAAAAVAAPPAAGAVSSPARTTKAAPAPAPVESSDEEDEEPVAPPVATPKPSLTVKSRKTQQ